MASISNGVIILNAVAQANNNTDAPTFYHWYGDSNITSITTNGTWVASNGMVNAKGGTYNNIAFGATNLMSLVGVSGTNTNTNFLDVINDQITTNGGTNNNGTGSATISATVQVSGTKGAIYAGQNFTPGSNFLMAQDAKGVTYKWPSASLLVAFSTTSTGTFSTFEPGGSSASTLASILSSILFNTTTEIAKATGTFYVEYQLSVGGSVVVTSTAQPVIITANQASLLATASTSIYTGSTESAAFTPLSLVTTATDYAGTSIDDSSHVSYTITNSLNAQPCLRRKALIPLTILGR